MSKPNHGVREQQALKISLYGVVFFVLLALIFTVYTKSAAILFDGVYSLIGFAMALLTLKVARLVERPDDNQFHFGYSALEPTLNLFKSLIIIVACIYAGVEALKRLLAGGTEAEYGWAVIYGVIATSGCFLVAALMRRIGRDTRSVLVSVEAKYWFIDGLLSASVLLGFSIAWVMSQSSYYAFAPYVDPFLLIIIVIFALPIPAKVLIASFREVIVMAPPIEIVDEIEQRLMSALEDIQHDLIEFRVYKRGRDTYLLVHIVVADEFSVSSIAELDVIRHASIKKMQQWKPEIVMDILFVKDKSLAI